MLSKEEAFQKVAQLVERFTEQYDSYLNPNYNETLARRDFIDPFFKALGWDMDNEAGNAENYREVIHEDRIKISGKTKAPDYSFRLAGGKKLFFLEAKRPSVKIKDDAEAAYQIRRYGWSAKMPISILTDFEELAIYDCSRKPQSTDKTSVARIKYLTFRDYLSEFDFIWDTLSKERVLKGSFDKYVSNISGKKGTATVDTEFLNLLDQWRIYLATDLSWKNKKLSEDELNYAVQQTIDRLIFLRIAEDRGIEPYGNIKTAIKQGNYYQNLFSIFQQADTKYNAGLFDFKKDTLCANLKMDNKVMRTIVNELYYPLCPYEFSVIPVEILGHAYEQFLGKQIKIDDEHRAIIEEKPEVRKAGGVYYTPQYVVDYLVAQTIGPLLAGKNPEQASKIKIVDPSCGSGSFLLGAYQFLLSWHREWYKNNPIGNPKKLKNNPLNPEGKLSAAEKKRILVNNIFGVDIDVNAVEVTKLSLLLKCLEGETEASINHQLSLVNERVLPTLDENIKDGNSLVDTDFYLTIDFGDDKKTKPFNWQNRFPKVFEDGGFDVVIGNPPYFSLDTLMSEQKNYLENRFTEFATRQSNIYFFFIARALQLVKEDGIIGFINERYYFNSKNASKFRNFINKNLQIKEIVDFKNIQVFDQANTLTVINVFQNTKERGEIKIIQFADNVRELEAPNIMEAGHFSIFNVKQNKLDNRDWNFNDNNLGLLAQKLNTHTLLGNIARMGQGIKSGLNDAFIVGRKNIKENKIEKKLLNKYIKTRDIQRYKINFRDLYLILTLKDTKIEKYPNTQKYLEGFKSELEARYQFKDGTCAWYSLSIPQNLSLLKEDRPKIFTPLYSKGNKFGLDMGGNEGAYFILTDAYVIIPNPEVNEKYLLALLNSSLLNFYNKKFGKLKRDGYYEYSKNTLSRLPIKQIATPSEQAVEAEIIKYTDQLLTLYPELEQSKVPADKAQIEAKIEFYEQAINDLIYQLYQLDTDEIRMVEQALEKGN